MITLKTLQLQSQLVNELLGAPNIPVMNHHYIDAAYGRYRLVRVVDTSGSTIDALGIGYVPGNQLLRAIHGLIAGLRYHKGINHEHTPV